MIVTSQGIFFDPVGHGYWTLHNQRILSNTEFLEAMGFSDYSSIPPHIRDQALQRGTDVHRATYLLDIKRPWKKSLGHVAGYVAAWRKLKKDWKLKAKLREEPLWDPHYMVATCPDFYGSSIKGNITLQIKTGRVEDWVGLQLAFEERCIKLKLNPPGSMESTDKRYAVELRADGTYVGPKQFRDPNDIKIFLGALSYFRWMNNHGKGARFNGNGQ